MADSKLLNTSTSGSPPPNCAICLGSCSNKCFSDTCMHQFCFNCLLQWSKIKAECPLCKQPFKSIIHNVKSNEEYEEHIVEQPRPVHILDNEQFHLILPHSPPPPSRHHRFHFRTTFTVNTHGENAIQQMLMSHSLTNGITISNYLPHSGHYSPRPRRRARATTTSFRRSIYDSNLWSSMHSDPMSMTVRYRQITPDFFRANPASRGRLVPWLNRELNALLRENTQQVMELVDRIMDYLLRYHICSGPFRNLLRSALGNRTDHFVHEFYNFMRSPFDMVGYDRHVNYYERPTTPTPFIDVSEDDSSDVMIVEENPEVIEVHSSDSDDDVIMTSSFVPKPRLLTDGLMSQKSRRVSVSSSSSDEEQQREEERPRKRNLKRSRRESENRQTSRDLDNDSNDEDSSSSVLDDVPLAKYMRIKASIGKKLLKKSGALAKALSKDGSKERKRRRSRSKKGSSKKPRTSEASSSFSSRAHCSKYQPRKRDTSSSSSSRSSSSSSSHDNELRSKKNRRRSCSSSRSQTMTPPYPEPAIQMAVNNTVMASPCYDRTLSNRIHGDYASMFRSSSASPGEGPSGVIPPYVPVAREHSSQSAIDTSIQTQSLEPETPQMFSWKDHESLASKREKSRREVMIRYRQHLMGQQHNSHHSSNNAASSSSSSSSSVYIPRNDKNYQPPSFYNSRSSPDLIDLSVTSRIKHDSPLTVACVPPEIRARYRASPSRQRFYSPCIAEAMENNSRLQNSLLPSTSYAPYNYESVSNTVFKSEPSYSEYQSEGSTKYWTDLSTHSHTNSNDSSYNYESQQPRKSVIQNSRDNSVPPQNEIISPRWSSSNSPSYPCCPETWSDNSD
ncbi:E3 ubiquitin-protein ligase Topors-like [Coccinella septempunctata]|uniref:E3 ubiquitin-protein ligase Topors-like n=1 Tax=Coccinella septempunctata TaxID=41139 RepID=UPI001D084BB2|nr:E3 ubiquitin-protein ligase Topors-like [Coccinella septempunctata]